jgi:hypothetical protein
VGAFRHRRYNNTHSGSKSIGGLTSDQSYVGERYGDQRWFLLRIIYIFYEYIDTSARFNDEFWLCAWNLKQHRGGDHPCMVLGYKRKWEMAYNPQTLPASAPQGTT